MNIKLIKQEIATLSTLIASWEEDKSISAIERNLALGKLTSLYELIGFGGETAPTTQTETAAPAIAPVEDISEQSGEQEIEVEIIFADDEDEDENEDTASEDIAIEQEDENAQAQTEEVAEPAAESAAEVPQSEVIQPEEIATADNMTTYEEPAPAPAPTPAPTPTPAEEEPEAVEQPQVERPQPRSTRRPAMESLFGAEEIQRKPRSKHQRMMAIYGEAQPKQDKVVDISKIFDMNDDATFEVTANKPSPAAHAVTAEENTTLSDAITPAATLAESMAAPTALAEEIKSSQIKSLYDGIGINDKFLMIRDLFNGDGDAYNEAIDTLDSLPSLEECMVHIIENYSWNPDIEGSKFIMKLLQRKFS